MIKALGFLLNLALNGSFDFEFSCITYQWYFNAPTIASRGSENGSVVLVFLGKKYPHRYLFRIIGNMAVSSIAKGTSTISKNHMEQSCSSFILLFDSRLWSSVHHVGVRPLFLQASYLSLNNSLRPPEIFVLPRGWPNFVSDLLFFPLHLSMVVTLSLKVEPSTEHSMSAFSISKFLNWFGCWE